MQKCAKILCRSLQTNVRGSCDIIAEVTRSKGLAISLPSISSADRGWQLTTRCICACDTNHLLGNKAPSLETRKESKPKATVSPKGGFSLSCHNQTCPKVAQCPKHWNSKGSRSCRHCNFLASLRPGSGEITHPCIHTYTYMYNYLLYIFVSMCIIIYTSIL